MIRPGRELRVSWVCRAAILVALVGVFGTWRRGGGVSLNGVEGPHNGWLVVIFGLVALAAIGPLARESRLGAVAVIGCSAVMLSTALQALVDDRDVLGGRSGWGLWLTIGGSLLLGAAAVVAVARPRLWPGSAETQRK